MAIESNIDFRMIVDGTGMGLLVPKSDAAKQLLADGAFGDVVTFGSGIGVDRRYVWDLVDNLMADGYVVVV